MMKHLGGIVAMCAVVTLLVGCITGHDVSTNEPVELRLRAVMSQSSRPDAEGEHLHGFSTTFPTDADLGLWAHSLPRDKKWAIFHPDAKPIATDEHFTYNSEVELWYPAQPLAWLYADALTLFAYSPYEVPAYYDQRQGVVIADFDTKEWEGVDLLYADVVADCHAEKNMDGVPLPFHHALSKVDIKAHTILPNDYTLTITKVEIVGVATKGTLTTLPTPQWSALGERGDVVLYDNEEGWNVTTHNNLYIEGAEELLIPQSGTIYIKVYAEVLNAGFITYKELTTPKLLVAWEPGKYYTYNLAISLDSVAVEEPKNENGE